MAYGTSQGTAATELLVGPSGALPRCAVLGTARSAAGFLRRSLMWCSLGRLWPHPMSPPIGDLSDHGSKCLQRADGFPLISSATLCLDPTEFASF